jgi:hypothetical protein
VVGCGGTALVASSQNGYSAGFVFIPIFLFICFASLLLFVISVICLGLKNKFGWWLLLSTFLLPASFISSALTAKYFEIGAYRQEPMILLNDEINNIVVFKADTTNGQVNDFWEKTMSIEREDGRGYNHLPGVGSMTRIQTRNGREAIAFSFFSSATEEQRQFVFTTVKSSPIVFQLLENELLNQHNNNLNLSENGVSNLNLSENGVSNESKKTVVVKDTTNSK